MNASIGLLETITANLTEKRPDIKRPVAAALSGISILVMTIFPAFSGTIFRNVRILGRTVIEFFDSALINVCLPIAVLGIVLLFFKTISRAERQKLFINSNMPTSIAMYSHWEIMLKWVVPALIVLGLLMLLAGIFI